MGKATGDIPIMLDRERMLRYDMNAYSEFETAAGETLFKFFGKYQGVPGHLLIQTIGVKNVRLLLWAGLIHEDPGLSIAKVGDLMDLAPGDGFGEKFNYIVEKFGEAYLASCGSEAKKKAQQLREEMEKEAAIAGTGTPFSGTPSPTLD